MYDVKNIEELISKSLEGVEELTQKADKLSKSVMPEEQHQEPTPDEVSQDAPAVEDNADEEQPEVSQGEEGQEEPMVDEDEPVAKSLKGEMEKNDNVKKALEVSEFLNELTTNISNLFTDHSNELVKSLQSTEGTQVLLAKSFEGMLKSQRAVMETQEAVIKSINQLAERLELVESKPIVRKSMSSNPVVVEKDFKKSLGDVTTPKSTVLSKSEALAKLEGEFSQGNTSLMKDILSLDSNGDINNLSSAAKKVLGI